MTPPEPPKASPERCEELRDALESAKSRLTVPSSTVDPAFGTSMNSPTTGNITADASEELRAEVRQLEQALRDAGCHE